MLVIMDKPKHPQTALKRALALQDATAARVEAVSFCWHPMAAALDVLEVEQRRAIRDALLKKRKAWLRQCVDDAQGGKAGGEITRKAVWTDDIAGWTTRAVEKRGIDLVVKSVHYSRTLLHTPLDWQLLRSCTAPVLLTSARRRKTAKVVLAALDLSRLDRAHQHLNGMVLASAQAFAERTGAELHCAYVIELSEVLRDLDVIDARQARKKAVATVSEALEGLVAPYGIAKSRRHFPIGKVGQSLQFLASKLKAELLVVGTAAHPIRQTLGIGNSAERVLSRAACDVLAVRP
ncbi:MAG: hypothetical protein F4171_14545 [Gammaproteobacteria bacterium]|nr:hypothetical protein [Gammaproteobacteria bacterium]MYG13988.1 hypothetical protein [Gammaproteobacteria bacterium]MYK27066.1 hypothetical protein [Gammaproteobacteria bacterium]